ncbi:hypothetical protein NE237_000142 [Protea cynaroides]|uniref:Uncharacterized protein n=1 Tax=Protea cynaroides TaxID=273540 RepID=A0A9Q0GM28_9MAGN|nr:hypothetical protein NE237_000142 [Protea cynaroides]
MATGTLQSLPSYIGPSATGSSCPMNMLSSLSITEFFSLGLERVKLFETDNTNLLQKFESGTRELESMNQEFKREKENVALERRKVFEEREVNVKEKERANELKAKLEDFPDLTTHASPKGVKGPDSTNPSDVPPNMATGTLQSLPSYIGPSATGSSCPMNMLSSLSITEDAEKEKTQHSNVEGNDVETSAQVEDEIPTLYEVENK